MTGPIETASAVALASCIAIAAWFVVPMPRAKPSATPPEIAQAAPPPQSVETKLSEDELEKALANIQIKAERISAKLATKGN